MKGIIVARLKCGCAASAWFDYRKEDAKDFGRSVAEWMEKGYTVSLEDRTTISAEKCPLHRLGEIVKE